MELFTINKELETLRIADIGEYPLKRMQEGEVATETQHAGLGGFSWLVYKSPQGIVDPTAKARENLRQSGGKIGIFGAFAFTLQLSLMQITGKDSEEVKVQDADWAIVFTTGESGALIEKIIVWPPLDYHLSSLCHYLAKRKYGNKANKEFLLAMADVDAAKTWISSRFQVQKALVGKFKVKGFSRNGVIVRWVTKSKDIAKRDMEKAISVKTVSRDFWHSSSYYSLLTKLLARHENLRTYIYEHSPESEDPGKIIWGFHGMEVQSPRYNREEAA
ncbi:MAG: hypothetical protein AAB632_03155 [Patescibacteria group bacterium]